MQRPDLSVGNFTQATKADWVCPHCGTLQVSQGLSTGLGPAVVTIFKCMNCQDVEVNIGLLSKGYQISQRIQAYPEGAHRRAKSFSVAPHEVDSAYQDACSLFSVHTGAAGAYARRALELILDNSGYATKSLAQSIDAARSEVDADKRLPKRLLQKLDYIKEIGNFALHVRRNDELTIVPIDSEEVSACLETIEDLINFLFEEPVAEYKRTLDINSKLVAAGKKPIALPDLPPGVPSPQVTDVTPA